MCRVPATWMTIRMNVKKLLRMISAFSLKYITEISCHTLSTVQRFKGILSGYVPRHTRAARRKVTPGHEVGNQVLRILHKSYIILSRFYDHEMLRAHGHGLGCQPVGE